MLCRRTVCKPLVFLSLEAREDTVDMFRLLLLFILNLVDERNASFLLLLLLVLRLQQRGKEADVMS